MIAIDEMNLIADFTVASNARQVQIMFDYRLMLPYGDDINDIVQAIVVVAGSRLETEAGSGIIAMTTSKATISSLTRLLAKSRAATATVINTKSMSPDIVVSSWGPCKR